MPAFTFRIDPVRSSTMGWTVCEDEHAECFRVMREFFEDSPELWGYRPTRRAAWAWIAARMGKLPL